MVERPNCVGYVYHALGLRENEEYIHPPFLEEILKDFTIVENPRQASAIAVVIFDQVNDPLIIHMAKIEKGSWTVKLTHRKGVGNPIINENIKQGLQNFTNLKYAKTVFLALRKLQF